MNIRPDGILFVCSGIPLSPDYTNTIDFNTPTEQFAYFTNKAKFKQFNYSYVKDGIIKVEIPADSLYNCNYLVFRNRQFSEKYFYAFITDIRYINNITSEIYYQIDNIQTWMFEMELEDVFVEREHSETDRIGDNLVPENLETGDYIIATSISDGWLDRGYKIVVAATFDKNKTKQFGDIYNGLYSGLTFIEFPNTQEGALELVNWLDGLEDKVDGIVSIFYMPAFVEGRNVTQKVINAPFEKINFKRNGAQPNNNKLHTFPYTAMYVTNNQGNSATFKYENFLKKTQQNECSFSLTCDYSCSPTAVLFPINYNNKWASQQDFDNLDEKLTLTGFPMVPWISNTFQAWLAQNAGSLAVRVGGSVVDLGMLFAFSGSGSGSGAPSEYGSASAITNFATNITDVLQTVYTHARQPNHAQNTGGGSNAMAILNNLHFTIQQQGIKPEFVDIIDSYFDRFGYATHVTKRPNLKSRPYYNYIKTIGCDIRGDIPVTAKEQICRIFDTGITFWHNPNIVGSYSVDNRAVVR